MNSILRRISNSGSMKLHAFTLAEILITIGIIGVVAAITIPLLIQNSNSKKFTTQFKKSLSTLNQAAIGAQAQYDLDYSLLTQVNDDSTCKSNTLAGGQYNFCGLFNNTLAGHTYIGKYGNVKGANASSPYSANVTSFSIENFLFFSFADGAIVAFNPNAKSCGIGVGQTLTTEKLTNSLANCIGFIDVNGPTPPNKEVQCAEETTTISANTTCKVTNGSMGDIFPVVFHDGAVEPATNASLAAFLGGNGKEEQTAAPKYDLSTPEGRKQADVDTMNAIADIFEKAFVEDGLKISEDKWHQIHRIQLTVYGDENGGDTKLHVVTAYSSNPVRNRIYEQMPDLLKNAGIDINNIKVNSTDDKWKYGYTVNYEMGSGKLEIWARNKNNTSNDYDYWYNQNVITENDMK